jgi:hypothetical protein
VKWSKLAHVDPKDISQITDTVGEVGSSGERGEA